MEGNQAEHIKFTKPEDKAMAKIQDTFEETMNDDDGGVGVDTNTVESGVKRTHRVSNNIVVKDDTITFTFVIKGLENPVVFTLDAKAITEEFPDKFFLLKAAATGVLSKAQIAYAGVTNPVEIETILQGLFTEFSNGDFESRNFGEKKVTLPDVVIAWIRYAGKDINDKATSDKYLEAYNKKSAEEKRKFGLNKSIIDQLQVLAAERLAARAVRADSVEQVELEVL